MSKLDKEQVIAAFIEAYKAENSKAPAIEAKGGWYSVDGGKNIRLADLNAMIAELGASTPADKATVAIDKPKKATKTKAAKAPAREKAKKTEFSVKAFWAKKILEESTVSKLPR